MHRENYTYKPLDGADEERNDIRVWYRRPSVYWLLPVFLLFSISMGALTMPRTNLLISLTCRNVLSELSPSVENRDIPRRMKDASGAQAPANASSIATIVIGEHNDQCSITEVESATALLDLWGNLIAGVLGAMMTPVWGRMSDRYGRVRVLAVATSIMLLSQVTELLMAVLPDSFSLSWIWVSFIFEGLSGTFILIMALGSAYAGDCTSISKRSTTMGLLHGSIYFGMAFGPVFGGFIGMRGGESRPLAIFYTCLIMNAVAVIYTLLLLPESLPPANIKAPQHTSPRDQETDPPSSSILELLQRLNPLRIITGLISPEASSDVILRRNLIAFAAINTVVFATIMASMDIIMLYSEYTFHWDNQASGTFLSAVNITRTGALIFVLPAAVWLSNRYMPTASGLATVDLFLIRTSIVADVVGYVGYALAPTGALFTLAGVIAALDSIALAVSEAGLSKLAGRGRMGEVLGALGFLQACARIVGPTVAGITYSQTVGTTPNLVYWGFATMFGIAGVVTLIAQPGRGDAVMMKGVGDEDGEEEVPLQDLSCH